MKKTNLKTRLLSTSLALLMLLSLTMQALTSCAKKEKEDGEFEDKLGISELSDMEKVTKLIELTNNYYDKAMKQTASANLTMSGKMMGVDFESSGTFKQTEIADLTAESPGHMSTEESHMTTIVGSDEPVEQISTEMSGYADGYMYLAIIPDNDEARATYKKTPCEFEDYSDLQEAKTENGPSVIEALIGLAEKYKVSQKDGKWVASASGINPNADTKNNEFLNSFITNAPCEFTVTDMSMKITFNGESGVAEKATFKIKMESVGDANFDIDLSIDMSIKFSLPSGNENFTPEYFDLYETDIDLYASEKAVLAIENFFGSEGINFSMNTVMELEQGNGNGRFTSISKSDEEASIQYGVKNGRFVYQMTVDRTLSGASGNSVTQGTMTYDGSKLKTELRGQGTSVTSESQQAARNRVFDSALQHLNFSVEDVTLTRFYEKSNGSYEIILYLNVNDAASSIMENSSFTPDEVYDVTHTLDLVFNSKGELTRIEYRLVFSQKIEGYVYRFTLTSDINYISKSNLSFITK